MRASPPPVLEPLADWTRTGKVELPYGYVRLRHWWSARLTEVKAAALLEAATGRECHAWRLSKRVRSVAGCRHPSWRAKVSAWPAPTTPHG